MFRKTKVCSGLMLAFGGGLTLGALPALAQQQLERVEITGSAIKRIDAETSVPVTVIKIDDLKKQGVTSIEQIMATLSAVQVQQGTSQSVGAGTGGAAFADVRGIGANKTLVLLNGRRIANNALDSSAPDMNMIPFAALERVELLRDGASALYGTDAIGGVINFITRRDFVGGSVSLGYDKPQDPGAKAKSGNIGFGFGDLNTSGFNVFAFVDLQKQEALTGTQRPWNRRQPGGLSPSPFPANYFQSGASGNPSAATGCSDPNLISDGGTGCFIATTPFVDYIPESERTSGMLKGTLKLGDNHRLGLEYFGSRSKVTSKIAPVPYGGLWMNPTRPDGSVNPYYPTSPNIPLSSTYTQANMNPGCTLADPNVPGVFVPSATCYQLKPGFINVKWRDLVHGQRTNIDTNRQQRFIASLDGTVVDWDYQIGLSYNENKYTNGLAGYSDGPTVTRGVLDGVINPFGDQSADGAALLATAGREGTLQTAKGTVTGLDVRGSREIGDWFKSGRAAAIAIGAEFRREKFLNEGNVDFATKVIASTGFDPNTHQEGDRNISAGYAELNVPILKSLEVTGAVRYDKYSDFGNTTNPKVSFRFQPLDEVLLRGSYSTGFRAPSLYELNAAQTYTNTGTFDDPINCPSDIDGDKKNDPIPGKGRAGNCQAQFQRLTGGNQDLKPEKSKNATLGIVFEPVKDASIAVDFWWLKVKQQIGSISDGTVLGDPIAYANLYHRNPQGDLATDGSQCPDPSSCGYIDTRTTNLGGLNTNGIDLSISYRLNAGTAGAFAFSLQNTYVTKYEYQDAGESSPWNQNVGRYVGTGPIFRNQRNVTVNWTYGAFGLGAVAHYKSGYLDQDPENRVGTDETFDLYGTWAPVKSVSLTLGVRNLMDREPPYSNQQDVFQANYDPRFSDPVGRTYYVRANYSF